ncbi:MAG: sugar phosphate nucleotidyltransferase [Solirubrobacterales bacterium]
MQALVLVGREGTRLRPLTERLPKPALPLAGRPFIAYMLEWLRGHGVDEVVMACGFEPAALREAIGDGDPEQRLHYLIEPERRGTGGGIRYAEGVLEDRFLALNGDLLCDLDLTALIREHERAGASATIGLVRVQDATGYGLVRTDAEGRVTEFVEKPDQDEAQAGGEINAGIYVLERSVLEQIPADREVSIEREVFPALVGRGLGGVALEGYWLDIGTPERFLQASWDILEGRVKTSVGELAAPEGLLVELGSEIDPEATISPPALVCTEARVGAGATIGPRAVLGPAAIVEPGARVEDSLVGERCTLGEGASLRHTILAPGAEVAAGAELEPGSVIAENEMVA